MSQIGNGNANAIFTKSVMFGDDQAPMLAFNYSLGQLDEELATVRIGKATLTIDANGGDTSSFLKVLVTLTKYDQNGDAGTNDTYTLSGIATGDETEWSGTAPTYVCKQSTLKGAIDKLNEIPGLQVFAADAPFSAPISNDDFVDTAVQDIPSQPGKYLKTLYRDIDAYLIDTDKFVAWKRIGIPEVRDADSLQLIGLDGLCTLTSTVNGKVKIYRDDIRDYGTEFNVTYATDRANKQTYVDKLLVIAQTAYVDNKLDVAPIVHCPLIIEQTATDLLTTTLRVTLKQATI